MWKCAATLWAAKLSSIKEPPALDSNGAKTVKGLREELSGGEKDIVVHDTDRNGSLRMFDRECLQGSGWSLCRGQLQRRG